MIIIIGYGCQMGVKSVIDVSTIHAVKGKSKLYANSFGTKRPWVRVPSPRPIKEAVAANAAAASFIFMSCFIVDISLKKIPQVKRERLRFIIELMRAGFTEDTKVNMISATSSILTAMNAISVLLLRDGADVVFIAPPSISEVILLFAICDTPSF